MMRRFSFCTVACFALTVLACLSCQRDPLELYYNGQADIHITYDWESKFGQKPDGMTLMLAHDGDSITFTDFSNDVDETVTRLNSGIYKLMVMNNTFGEYSKVSFYNRKSYNDFMVKLKTYYVESENLWDNGRTYMEEPEKIGIGTDTFSVKSSVDSIVFYDYRETAHPDTVHLQRHVVIYPMSTTLKVRVKVRGISNMKEMEGYITGMADGFYPNQGWRTKEAGTIKLSGWTPEKRSSTRADEPEEEDNVGWMTCNVETFGLPHGRELLKDRVPESNYIMLHFTLLDNSSIDFAYRVGKEIRYEGDDGTMTSFLQTDVALELNLEIDTPYYENDDVPILPYAQPSGTGAFDAEVEDWGEDVNVDVPM